jgi:hypothetical protein
VRLLFIIIFIFYCILTKFDYISDFVSLSMKEKDETYSRGCFSRVRITYIARLVDLYYARIQKHIANFQHCRRSHYDNNLLVAAPLLFRNIGKMNHLMKSSTIIEL